MAKPNKAKLKEEGVALKAMVKMARKRTLNFALFLGKDGFVLETHPLKGTGVLRKLAKSNGGGAKGTMGQLVVDGKQLILSVEEAPPGNFPKLLKTHLVTRGLAMKVVFKLPDGGVMDDGEPSEEGDGPSATSAPPETGGGSQQAKPDTGEADKIRAALTKAFNALKPELTERLEEAEDAVKSTAAKLMAAFDESMTSGNLKNSKKLLDGLQKLSDKLPSPKGILDSIGEAFDGVVEEVAEVAEKVKETVGEIGEDVGEIVGDFLGMELTEKDKENKAKTDALKLPADQQKDLIKLGRDNPKSFEQVLAALQAMQDEFGDQDTSPEGAADALVAAVQAQTKLDKLDAELETVRAELKLAKKFQAEQKEAAKKALAESKAAKKALDDFKAALPDLATMTKEEKLEAAKKANALINTLEAAKGKVASAKQALIDATADVSVLETKDQEAYASYDAAYDAKEAADEKTENLETKKTLLDALNTGVLSPDAEPAMSDEDRAAFVAAYKADPKMAAMALELAKGAKDPGLIAQNIGMLCDKVADGFADKDGKKLELTEDELREMAGNALKMGARQGEDYFKNFEKYLESGKQHEEDPCGGGVDSKADVGKKRSAMMGGAMLDSDGKFDPDSDKAKAAMDHMLFHPGSLQAPAPAMVEHMQATIKDFNDPVKGPQLKGIIDGIDKKPTNATALDLVAKTNGTTADKVDANGTKQAVMSAMFTPLAQGPVGSCFSTAPARKMRQDNPVKTMEKFAEIATTGNYTPAKGLPIKAVKANNLPDGENPLMRSFEYSSATAGARLANSRERKGLTSGLFAGAGGDNLGGIKAIVGDDWNPKAGTPPDPGLGAELQKAIAQKLTFKYNAKGAIVGGGGDGSSREGGFELVAMPDETPLLTQAAFVAAIEKIALETCGETKTSEKGLKIVALVNDAKFIKAMEKSYGKKPKDKPSDPDTFYGPWELRSGGFEDAATEALVGGTPSYDVFLAKKTGAQTPSERNSDMLSGMITAFAGATTDMVSMGTTGKNASHAFNALPNDPSWDKIKPPNTEDKIQSELIEPGKKIADTELEKDKTVALYEARIKGLLGSWGRGDAAALAPALKKLPTEGMKPAELNTYLLAQTKDFRDAYSKRRADNSKAKAIKEGKPFTNADWTTDEAEWQKLSKGWIAEELMGELVDALPMPEIKIADTNWGDNEGHTYFVMSPDPLTGDLILWKKDEIKGTMEPAGDNWSDAKWDTLK